MHKGNRGHVGSGEERVKEGVGKKECPGASLLKRLDSFVSVSLLLFSLFIPPLVPLSISGVPRSAAKN